jgi:Fe2+ transport system protein FeoA
MKMYGDILNKRLTQCVVGEHVTIAAIPNPEIAMMAVRLGISAGETVKLLAKIPGGPLVVQRGESEIALGRELCQGIEVQPQ